MRNAIMIRLEIIRSVRAVKFEILDTNIKVIEDEGGDASALKEHRKRLRNITEPYKTLLLQDKLEMDESNPMLAHNWDAFTSIDWN